MGRVYRVRNVISHRTEAMKVLLGDLQAEQDLAARFVSEIRTLATLDHPNIAQLHTALQVGNQLLMLMEFVDGYTLQQMATQNPVPLEEVVRYMHQVLAALSFAHSRGVIHRDIKPANVIVTPEGMAKLTDFGIAKSRRREDLTLPGTTVGSLNYMAPEQALGGKVIDERTDLYSLGITMYELLAGCKPFDDESAYVVLNNQLNTPPRPPIEVNPLLSKALNDVILKALEKDPANRFQSASEFSHALQQATGIATSVVIEKAGISPPTTAMRHHADKVIATSLAATSRFPTAVRRRIWVGAGSLAMLGIPVVTAVALPHISSRAMMNSAILPVKEWTPPAAASLEGLTTIEDDVAPGNAVASTSEPNLLPAAPVPHLQVPASIRRITPAPARVTPPREESATVHDVPSPHAEALAAPLPSPSTLAAVQEVRKQKAALDARAALVRQSVQHMKSEREAAGSTLPQDVVDAYVRMNAYLSAERSDLEDGDLASARDYMNKAATEVAALEQLFNK
jgi:serine/threonine-protein kinase